MEAIFPKTTLKTALKIAIWVFFRGLKSKFRYFLGFSKKIFDEHTYHFYIKSPPGKIHRLGDLVLVPKLGIGGAIHNQFNPNLFQLDNGFLVQVGKTEAIPFSILEQKRWLTSCLVKRFKLLATWP